jgi:hypothetical protein
MTVKLRTLSVAAAGALVLLLAALGGTAVAKDRNHDRIPDRWEKRHHLSLKVDQSNRDSDRDKVDNRNEFQEGTDPRDKDSDDDGRKDGREDSDRDGLNNMGEDNSSNLPNDRDTDDDGVRDGEENAGTIASFDGTTLVIDLAGGGQVSGLVTAATEIKCESEDSHELTDRSDDSGRGRDNSGPGRAGVAKDGADDPPGDDHGGDDGGGVDDRVCATADLVPGTPVHEAELAGTTFHEVELVK